METMQIYVVTHKDVNVCIPEKYKLLMVGAINKKNISKKYATDCVGDNISQKNTSYCELTGLYWMWKNAQEDIIGLVHYRRFFVRLKKIFDYRGRHVVLCGDSYHILTETEIRGLLENCDIIVKQSEYRRQTNQYLFAKNLGEALWNRMKEGVYRYAEEYIPELERMANAHQHMNCNMMIGRKSVMDTYCEWLFPLLEHIDMLQLQNTGKRYDNREIGYLSEILFGMWLEKNKINYHIMPVVNTGDRNAVNGVLSLGQFFQFFIRKVFERKR